MGQLAKFIKKISFCREPDEVQDCDCENNQIISTVLDYNRKLKKEVEDVKKEKQKLKDDLRKGLLYKCSRIFMTSFKLEMTYKSSKKSLEKS